MAEQWRDIAGYDGVYQVSDQGQVRNTQTGKILQPVKMKNGRLYVTLSSSGFQLSSTELRSWRYCSRNSSSNQLFTPSWLPGVESIGG